MSSEYDDLKEQIARSCRILGELDITKEALGHVSVRIGETETMLVKGKGPGEAGLRFTQPDDIILVDFEANTVEGRADLQPPSESFIHIWQYKTRPAVKSVIHMHPEHAVLMTIGEKEFLPITGGSARLVSEGIPVYPNSIIITTDQLGQDLAKVMGDKSVCLMRGHGVTVVGDSVEQSTLRTLELNEICTMMYKAHVLGNPKPILAEDMGRRLALAQEENRPRGNAGGRLGMMSRWRYYTALAEEKARK